MKNYLKSISFFIGFTATQSLSGQVSESDVITAIKKTKCLAQMTNCDARQDYFYGVAQYWECYLENNFVSDRCILVHPMGNLPDCPEDDLNFPTETSTRAFMDKCITRLEVVIVKKKNQESFSQNATIASITNEKKKSKVVNTEETTTLVGIYAMSGIGVVSGNIGDEIQINEEILDSKGNKLFTINSMGKEVLRVKRQSNRNNFTASWIYSELNPGLGSPYLSIARTCIVSISEDGNTVTLQMKNVKTRPIGGGFMNGLSTGLSAFTLVASEIALQNDASKTNSKLRLSDGDINTLNTLKQGASESLVTPIQWEIVPARKETTFVFEKKQ